MSFFERMKEIIDQGVENTKKVLNSAAEKAKELGELGVLKYEINQLEKQVEKRFALLGGNVYSILVEKNKNTVSKSTSEIKELLDEINDIEKRIDQKEAEVKKIENKENETKKEN
jgi:peptidoglycan hydrolase CwlO-like protein